MHSPYQDSLLLPILVDTCQGGLPRVHTTLSVREVGRNEKGYGGPSPFVRTRYKNVSRWRV